MKKIMGALCPVLAGGVISAAADQVLVSNLDQLWAEGGVGEFHGVFADPTWGPYPAGIFRTGPDWYQLASIRLEHGVAGVPPISDGLRLTILPWSPGAPTPGSPALAELAFAGISGVPTHYPGFTQYADYSSLSPVVLEPDTAYWLGAFLTPGAPDATLMFVRSFAESGLPGWSILDLSPGGTVGGDGRIQWHVAGGYGGDILKFEVLGAVVPEPSSWLLLTFGLAGLGIWLCCVRNST